MMIVSANMATMLEKLIQSRQRDLGSKVIAGVQSSIPVAGIQDQMELYGRQTLEA
jgi:hypothetical protein